MSQVAFSDVLEVDELETFIDDLAEAFETAEFIEALEDCKIPIAANFIEIFANEQDSRGGAWPEHAPATVAMYGEHSLLVLSGMMFQSLINEGAQHHVGGQTGRHLKWGTNVFYAMAQNYGKDRIPSREFAYWTVAAGDKCLDVIADYIDETFLG